MVILCIKRGDENQFLYEAKLSQAIEIVKEELVAIYNGRLKISRICSEMEDLSNHGISLPANMVGLTDEQIEELHLKDEFSESCYPSGGFVLNKDPTGRRNGQQPLENMQKILKNAITEAKNMVKKKLVGENKSLTFGDVQNAIDILKGATHICYPMGLPSYDPIKMEFMNIEDLSGKQTSLEVIEPTSCQLWFAGRLLLPGKLLKDFMGYNEKSKVIVKIAKKQEGAPSRELPITEEQRKQMMLMAYRRQEELKNLEQDDDDTYLDSNWSDRNSMRKHVHGLENVKFKF